MHESVGLLIALSIMSACAVAMTVMMAMLAKDVRRALRRAEQSLNTAQRILALVERGTRQVETVVARVADAAGGALDRLAAWKDEAAAFFTGRVRNGVGSEPHRRYRRS